MELGARTKHEWGYNCVAENQRGVIGKLKLSKLIFIVFAFCAVAAIASPGTTVFTSLVSCDVTNGSSPYYGSLIQGTDGNFYRTAAFGGTNAQNCHGDTCGTVFKTTPAGALTILHWRSHERRSISARSQVAERRCFTEYVAAQAAPASDRQFASNST